MCVYRPRDLEWGWKASAILQEPTELAPAEPAEPTSSPMVEPEIEREEQAGQTGARRLKRLARAEQ